MACNTGSTCFSGGIVIGPSNPTNCGVDPCLAPRTITDLVFYNGPALSCSSIKTCDTLTVAIQKLDDKICTTISPITASNGLYLNVNDVRMGGELIEVTTIITDSIYTLAIQGLIPEPDPDYLVSQTLGGILQKTNTSSFISGILSQITADNGLTKTGNNIQLGGPLIKNTTIDMDSYSYQLSEYNTNGYSLHYADSAFQYFETGSNIITSPSGSFTRTINFKSSAGIYLTNFLSPAYNAQAAYLAAHPWISTPIPASNNFQIYDFIHRTNTTSAAISSFYDERVYNPSWNETWTSAHPLSAGNVYTIRIYQAGDDFSNCVATIISGVINTSGCVFESNGNVPNDWSNGSTIDGDFPVIDYDIKSADVMVEHPGGIGQVWLRAKKLDSNLSKMALGFNNPVNQDYSMAIGVGNNITGTGLYAFTAGVGNVLSGTSIFALGEGNTVNTNCAGALGCYIDNQSYLSFGIGYDLEIPGTNTGTHQVGVFNDVNAIDYTDYFGDSTYPSFSIGSGDQGGTNPAEKMNAFHVFANGFVKSKNGHDSRGGTRGVLPPQWSDLGWERYAPAGGDFIAGHKYIINAYTSGDDFSNIALFGQILWGQMNNRGCIFIAGVSGSATNWTTSTIIEVGRPTSPELGEMGFNLDSNCMEYWNGLDWCQLCCTTTTTTTIIL